MGKNLDTHAGIKAAAVFAVLLCLLAPNRLRAQDCLDYSEYQRFLASEYACFSPGNLVHQEGLLFVGQSLTGATIDLVILRVVAPADLERVSRMALPGELSGIAVAGNMVFVSCYQEGLLTIDVSDPAVPHVIGSLELGESGSLTIAGTLLIMSARSRGLVIIDVANLAAPQLLARLDTVVALESRVSGSLVYVADGKGGLEVVDISEPSVPQRLHITHTPQPARAVELFDDRALLTAEAAGLVVVDIADPGDWQRILGVTETPPAYEMNREGDEIVLLHNAYAERQVATYDVSDLLHPVLLGALRFPYCSAAVHADSLLAIANYATGYIWLTSRASTAPAPALGELTDGIAGTVNSLAFDQGLIYAATSTGLHIVDVQDPAAPTMVGLLASGQAYLDVAVAEGVAYLAAGEAGFLVADVSAANRPHIIGADSQLPEAVGVALIGDLCAIADGQQGLHLYDVTEPAQPQPLAEIAVPGGATSVALHAENLLAIGNYQTFLVYDCSLPAEPILRGQLSLSCCTRGIAVQGNIAYCANDERGLLAIDISESTAPILLAEAASPQPAGDVAVAGNLAYLAAGSIGTQIYDVSDPSTPALIGMLIGSGDTNAVWASEEWFCAGGVDAIHLGLPACGPATLAPTTTTTGPELRLRVYPNPSNPQCRVQLTVPSARLVRVDVLDVMGRRCRTLVDHWLAAGSHQLTWNGCDGEGLKVASGTYFVQARWAGGSAQAKVVLVK